MKLDFSAAFVIVKWNRNEPLLLLLNPIVFVFSQLYFDDVTETAASPDQLRKNQMPKEIPVSEAPDSINLPVLDSTDAELDELRKQITFLEEQVVTALDQAKNASDREKSALHRAKQATENEQTAVAKLSHAAGREEYLLELMTTASQDVIGNIHKEPPSRCLCDFLDITIFL